MKTIGILGGGQLGVMLAVSIQKYGGKPVVLANASDPAVQLVAHTIVGSWSDKSLLESFFGLVDVATIEVEHVDLEALRPWSHKLLPSMENIQMAQNRRMEKHFIRDAGLPHAKFWEVTTEEEVRAAAAEHLPLIFKTTMGGYDGRGQFRIESLDDLDHMIAELGDILGTIGLVAEEIINLHAEASCIVVRDPSTALTFPIFDNSHVDHILDITTVPSALTEGVQESLRDTALKASSLRDAFGLLTVEFFITKEKPAGPAIEVDGHFILINEFAPRPHNSGHITRNATTLSQFDALARVLLDIPVPEPVLYEGGFAMANLLSDLWGDRVNLDLPRAALEEPKVIDVVLYGKEPNRLKRKMGHLITHSADVKTAVAAAIHARTTI